VRRKVRRAVVRRRGSIEGWRGGGNRGSVISNQYSVESGEWRVERGEWRVERRWGG
jgi:hypothetical protein